MVEIQHFSYGDASVEHSEANDKDGVSLDKGCVVEIARFGDKTQTIQTQTTFSLGQMETTLRRQHQI